MQPLKMGFFFAVRKGLRKRVADQEDACFSNNTILKVLLDI